MKLFGIGAAPGIAVGPAFFYAAPETLVQRSALASSGTEAELERFTAAVERAAARLETDSARLTAEGQDEAGSILEAHIELVRDEELREGVARRIHEQGISAAAAVLETAEEYAALLSGTGDEYLAARAADVRDVAGQIVQELLGESAQLEHLETPSVILAENLAPSQTARIPKGMALGFVTAGGSAASHVSIMARSLGVPTIVGVGATLKDASSASVVAVDGAAGYAITDPTPDTLKEFQKRATTLSAERATLESFKHIEARTKKGRHIKVLANLGSDAETAAALQWGADGVGLFRTEFLFMEREELPDEEEQYAVYRRAAEAFGERPVIIRTLDVGGDKPLPGIEAYPEANPFLGRRGLRISLDTPQLFEPQLRAILRAAAHGNLQVMFPMVADIQELKSAKEILARCRKELQALGKPSAPLKVGVMIEIPSAALCAEELAQESDFFSIGTNDLTQYTLAADRGNGRLAPFLHDASHPAVMKLIKMVCEAGERGGIPVEVCGEAGGDPRSIPGLIEAGVTGLSMNPPAIPRAKKLISEL